MEAEGGRWSATEPPAMVDSLLGGCSAEPAGAETGEDPNDAKNTGMRVSASRGEECESMLTAFTALSVWGVNSPEATGADAGPSRVPPACLPPALLSFAGAIGDRKAPSVSYASCTAGSVVTMAATRSLPLLSSCFRPSSRNASGRAWLQLLSTPAVWTRSELPQPCSLKFFCRRLLKSE